MGQMDERMSIRYWIVGERENGGQDVFGKSVDHVGFAVRNRTVWYGRTEST